MHLILTGATGLVGTSVLAHVLSTAQTQSPRRITHLSILTRTPQIPYLQRHPASSPSLKIDIIEHKDFTTYSPDLLEKLRGADGVVWALGVSQNDVKTEEEYTRITKTLAEEAAKAFERIPEKGQGTGTGKLNFVYVSGEGATHNPGMFTQLFGKVKGETEKSLLAIASVPSSTLRVYNVRPGGVDPSNQPDVAEVILPKFLNTVPKQALWKFMPVFRALMPGMLSPTRELGKVLTEIAVGDGEPLVGEGVTCGGWVAGNLALRRMAGL